MLVLVDQRAACRRIPFSWAHLTGGLAGLSAGFPLALFMFIGWENGPALAEESRDPRRTIPRALYISIAIAAALFVLFAYATVTGFGYDVSSIGRSSVPFLTVADHDLGGAAVLAWVAGIVSVLAALVAGASPRRGCSSTGDGPGLLPARLGRLRQPSGTPVNALIVMAVAGLGIIGVWWIIHLVTGHTGSMNPVGLYAECSTMGTIVILVVYLLTNALPSGIHVAPTPRDVLPRPPCGVPALGSIMLIVPFVELCQPGQPAPYSAFPFLALVLAAAAAVAGGLSSPSSARRSRRGSRIPGDLTGWPAEYLPWHTGSCS